MLIYYILIVLFGLAAGSFLNVVVLRLDDFKSILTTRSHCLHCKKELSWFELIPFFSYIFLAGKCLKCKKSISIQYPIVEMVTALIFLAIYLNFGITWSALLLAIIFSILIVIATYDAVNSEIPDILSYILIALGLIWTVIFLSKQHSLDFAGILPYIYAVLIGGGFFAFLVLVSRQKWMGAGDILLGVFMGIFLGLPQVLIALFLSFIIGALFAIVLLAFKQKTLKDALPFGPFLAIATVIAFFWGEEILLLYWNVLM